MAHIALEISEAKASGFSLKTTPVSSSWKPSNKNREPVYPRASRRP